MQFQHYWNQERKDEQLRKVVHYLSVSEVSLGLCSHLNNTTKPTRWATACMDDATCLSMWLPSPILLPKWDLHRGHARYNLIFLHFQFFFTDHFLNYEFLRWSYQTILPSYMLASQLSCPQLRQESIRRGSNSSGQSLPKTSKMFNLQVSFFP